jgi:phage gpG-like protein
MSVKWKTTINKLPQISANAETIKGRTVTVGPAGSDAWLAAIHEYGCTIKVTPKMRAFLHRQGLHLKESTTVIKIPERSFLRNGHDEHQARVIKQTERAIGQVLAGKMSVDDMLDVYGHQMATAIKKYMRDLKTPENHSFTVEQKGSSNPLVDTGQLISSITYRKTGI